jgi:hypothetical protein
VAEANPSVGIIGSYQLSGGGKQWYLRNDGLPYSKTAISGVEICRSHLLGHLSVFGNPTSNMYRADLVRSTAAFYPNATAEADVSACFKSLQESDFGFVHQVLSHERIHEVRQTTISLERNAYLSAAIADCQAYGPLYLRGDEQAARITELVDAYYRYLSASALKFKDKKFWQYHASRLQELGLPLDHSRLWMGILLKLIDLCLNPKETMQRIVAHVRLRAAVRGDLPLRGESSCPNRMA